MGGNKIIKNLEYENASGPIINEINEEIGEVSTPITQSDVISDIKKIKESEINIYEIYKTIVDTRKFEIENFWKRALFFWGTLAIILAGYFGVKNNENYLIFISLLGFFYNIIFSLSIRGSKYWQEHWEQTAKIYEKQIGFRLFSWSLTDKIEKLNKGVFFILKAHRFSVSKLTMILSDITILLWLILIIKDINTLIINNKIHFDLCIDNCKNHSFDFFTFLVIGFPLLFTSYITIFLIYNYKKTKKK